MIFILRRIFKYFAFVFKVFENKGIKKYGRKIPQNQPVFILGVPRSGTTVLYQLLTSYFDVSYVNNLVNLSRPNVFIGFRLANFLYKNKPHNSFHSKFGNTENEGLNAPSEAGQIWYRWLPKGDIILDEKSLAEKEKNDLRLTIIAILNRFNKPLVIKNLYFSLRIRLLSSLFPEAKYIVVQREPYFIAQSILIGRRKNNIKENEWWSVVPPIAKKVHYDNEYEMIAAQVYYLNKLIDDDLKCIRENHKTFVNYESFSNTNQFLNEISAFLSVDTRKELKFSEMNLKTSNSVQVSKEDEELLKRALEKYNF
jgi:hypothetical protein